MFIPDPDPDIFPSRIQGSKKHQMPDPGVKKAPDPGSATLFIIFRYCPQDPKYSILVYNSKMARKKPEALPLRNYEIFRGFPCHVLWYTLPLVPPNNHLPLQQKVS
jgi:hypothetical protein